MSSLPDMIVCTHQSLNRCVQVRKACVLRDKLTSGNKSTHRKRKWRRKAWRVGEKQQFGEQIPNILDCDKTILYFLTFLSVLKSHKILH